MDTVLTHGRRGFAAIAEGQLHYRVWSEPAEGRAPLLLLHASPASSLLLDRFARCFGQARGVIGFDTPGQGDSCPPRSVDVDMAYFADVALRGLDALGIGKVAVFGTHTGARIAAEMAIAAPDRVTAVVLDGIRRMPAVDFGDYAERVDLSRHIDQDGTQFHKTWNKWRSEYLFKPPHVWDLAELAGSPLPTPMEMHLAAVEVFKGIPHGHVAYRAAIRFDVDARLSLLRVPALVTCARSDGSLPETGHVASVTPGASVVYHEHRVEYAGRDSLQTFADRISEWLAGAEGAPSAR